MHQATSESGRGRGGPSGTRGARAFGLELDVDPALPAAGLPAIHGDSSGRRTSVRMASQGDMESRWTPDGTTRISEERFDSGPPARTIDHHPDRGYRLYARHFGTCLVAEDGSEIVCAPGEASTWNWQRFLVGRVLPFTAVLNGFEVFHASAVALRGSALALLGGSGAGKTSLAVHLVLQGATLLTDDALSVDEHGDLPRAHPGAALASLRHSEESLLSATDRARLGDPVGSDEKSYFALETAPEPLPLRLVYFVSRDSRLGEVTFERRAALDARVLLASTFVYSITTPQRLAIQLSVCACLARATAAFTAYVPAHVGAASLARALGRHAARTLEERG